MKVEIRIAGKRKGVTAVYTSMADVPEEVRDYASHAVARYLGDFSGDSTQTVCYNFPGMQVHVQGRWGRNRWRV